MTMPLLRYTFSLGSLFSGKDGCTACALSADSKTPFSVAKVKSSSFFINARFIFLKSVLKILDAAPCFVSLPTSSLSKQQQTAMSFGVAFIIAFSDEYTLKRLSSLGAHKNSAPTPPENALVAGTTKRSASITSLSVSVEYTSFAPPKRGSISFCTDNASFVFASGL